MEEAVKDMSKIEEKARLLKAISHPIRLCIVRGLMDREGYNVSRMQECLRIPQSTLSQHLTKLRDLGIVEGERDGVQINYYVVNETVKQVVSTIFKEKIC